MAKRPNIILFISDSYRGDVLGHMGNPGAVTPHADAFVADGAVSFRNAFCQNTVCVPSRCSFMSGWYPHVMGHRTMGHMLHHERGQPNFLKQLKDNGYFVWYGGGQDFLPGQDGEANHCNEYFVPEDADYERWGVQQKSASTPISLASGEPGTTYYSFLHGRTFDGLEEGHALIITDACAGPLNFLKTGMATNRYAC